MRWLLPVLATVVFGACGGSSENSGSETPAGAALPRIDGARVLMVIAHQNYRDEEYEAPKSILEKQGAGVVTASSSRETARGMLGGRARPDSLLGEVRAVDFDAVVFVGGSGAREYWDDPVAQGLARAAADSSRVLGAICIAPVTLARAGVLRGIKATVFKSEAENIREHGALYSGARVEVAGRIVTAEGPAAAEEFGRELVRAIWRARGGTGSGGKS